MVYSCETGEIRCRKKTHCRETGSCKAHCVDVCHIVNAYVAHLQGQPFAPVGVEKQSFASGLPSLLLVSLIAPS